MDETVFNYKNYVDGIQSLRNSVGEKDQYTLGHSDRVSDFAVLIGKKMGLPEEEIQTLKIGGLCHDIGKIGIEDSILFKETRLSDDEFAKMKRHPAIGVEMLENKAIFKKIIPIVKYHHERYDGKGYPDNLAGEQIPLLARITSVADAFDAMSSKRTYNAVMDVNAIKQEFQNNRGTQFDPIATDVFVDILENEYDKIQKIQEKYQTKK
ncbi:MAG: HD-GYP domain-containing protein [Clostridia bacterium]|nr:HD-GYP domain-containing protein [Clostridia bacterium]